MKQLMFIALLCLSAVTSNAQVTSITITNNTPCTVYYRLFGYPFSGSCATTYRSTVLSISGNTSVTYNAGNVPGGMNCASCSPPSLSNGDIFFETHVNEALFGLGCSSTQVRVGDPCNMLGTSGTLDIYDPVTPCNVCKSGASVTWTNNTTSVNLDIN